MDFSLAAAGESPTIIVASSKTMLDYHSKTLGSQTGLMAKIRRHIQGRSLQAGNMPSRNPIVKLAEIDSSLSLSKLRLLFISHRAADTQSPKLLSSVLSDLRMFLGARIGYAMTTAQVAGAVCQTHVLDYRRTPGANPFGPPLSSVEVSVHGDEEQVKQDEPRGKVNHYVVHESSRTADQVQIFVKGPAVCEGEVSLEVLGGIGSDNTLSLL